MGGFGRRVGGGWGLRRNKVNGIQQKEQVKGFLAARSGRKGPGGVEMENNKEQRWWFKKVGPAQAPLQIRAGRGRARRTLKAGSQSALSAISPPPDRPTIDETTHC